MINSIQLFNVSPSIPEPLRFLETLSRNLWWCWNTEAIELFQRMDAQLWKQTRHSPLAFLSRLPPSHLAKLANDKSFIGQLTRVKEQFEREVMPNPDGSTPDPGADSIAYFSLEYGIHESVRLYAGGLGCLAGDHLKAASDTHLPMVAVGLMYRQGYFQQYLGNDGWQQESYLECEINHLPLRKACDKDGHPVRVSIPLPDGVLEAEAWRLDVGRVPLYLLDTNIPDNRVEYRTVTARLYEGDRQMRLRQELLLGIGGVRLLEAIGIDPPVLHMNEGHAAFLSLARIAHLMQDHGLSLEKAQEVVSRTCVFTTHTPVPAGNETFDVGLIRHYFAALEKELGLSPDQIIAWGSPPGVAKPHEISLTILALRMSGYVNGVSQLHGTVARNMWHFLWPTRPVDEVPITHITNGVHISSWLSQELIQVFDKYLGPQWRQHPTDPDLHKKIDDVPDDLLWRAHESARSRLVRWTRERGEAQSNLRSERRSEVARIKSLLNHDALTIGFARRFASYKRATLLLSDPDRFEALLTNPERPVQFLFAGKAHPADNPGKELIKQIFEFSKRPTVRERIIFLENYDILMARHMVQGVDVWLNNPRRPLEASGTSGMKAAVNGGLHVSSLDGWWDEAYTPGAGWAIGHGEEYDNPEHQDRVEAQALYNILENEIIPCFYDRPDGDLPPNWIRMMKGSMAMALGFYTSHRMVGEYDQRFYRSAREQYERLTADNFAETEKLVHQRGRLDTLWSHARADAATVDRDITALHVGDNFEVTTVVHLGTLTPEDVDVEVYHGPVDSQNQITQSSGTKMELREKLADGSLVYGQAVTCSAAGRYGFTTRISPAGGEWRHLVPGFLTWASPRS